jgi:hypothetical protein
MNMKLGLLVAAGVLVLVFVLMTITKSGFVDDILNTSYGSTGCSRENRAYPSGKVPGSYFGLTQAERDNLLKGFINNNNNLT